MNTGKRRLIIFGREPLAGNVKTRLIPALGAAGAAALYAQMLRDTLAKASALDDIDTEFWCDFEDPLRPGICQELADEYGMALHRQQGNDLGERMYHAFTAMMTASSLRSTLLVGSDCPGYSKEYLLQAFSMLSENDAVLGPATDGGYVLIGLNRIDRSLFENIPWSTGEVLGLTRDRLEELSWRYAELPVLQDVDDPSDLLHYREANGTSATITDLEQDL